MNVPYFMCPFRVEVCSMSSWSWDIENGCRFSGPPTARSRHSGTQALRHTGSEAQCTVSSVIPSAAGVHAGAAQAGGGQEKRHSFSIPQIEVVPVSYTHLTLPTIYSV